MNTRIQMGDALGFVKSAASRINAEVYRRKYPEVQYRRLVPVDTTGPEWIESVTYLSMNGVGRADWINMASDDVPHVELGLTKTATPVEAMAIGYRFSEGEVQRAMMYGIELRSELAFTARLAAEQRVDEVAFIGDASKGITGVVNNAEVTVVDAAATGAGSSTEWEDKTPAQILADVNGLLTGVQTGTAFTSMADTLLLPYDEYNHINSTMITDHATMNILTWLRQNNAYTAMTGQPLTIAAIRGLEAAGQGGVSRAIAYRNSPEVLSLIMPMPFKFYPVWQTGPFTFEVPAAFRLSGVNFKLPKEAAYLDGV